MTDYRKIITLRGIGCSKREIARSGFASRETVSNILEAADRLGSQWPLDDDITNADLERMLFPDKERIQWFAANANAHDVFFVGRGVDYAVCLERKSETERN